MNFSPFFLRTIFCEIIIGLALIVLLSGCGGSSEDDTCVFPAYAGLPGNQNLPVCTVSPIASTDSTDSEGKQYGLLHGCTLTKDGACI